MFQKGGCVHLGVGEIDVRGLGRTDVVHDHTEGDDSRRLIVGMYPGASELQPHPAEFGVNGGDEIDDGVTAIHGGHGGAHRLQGAFDLGLTGAFFGGAQVQMPTVAEGEDFGETFDEGDLGVGEGFGRPTRNHEAAGVEEDIQETLSGIIPTLSFDSFAKCALIDPVYSGKGGPFGQPVVRRQLSMPCRPFGPLLTPDRHLRRHILHLSWHRVLVIQALTAESVHLL